MKRALRLLLPLLGAGLFFVAAPAEARNYDCSKAGNANKTVCKTAAAPSGATAPAPAAAPAGKTPIARHYDCSKAGNANKAVCKDAAGAPPVSPSAPAPAPATKSNAPAPRPMASAPTMRPMAPAAASPAGPAGASALCKDGSYSHSKTRSGTCSHHGGVATWY